MTYLSSSMVRACYVFLFFAALSFFNYYATLSHEFMLDDHAVLLSQEPGAANIAKALDPKDEGLVFFRPVTNLLRLGLISLFPKDPLYYHLLNIVLFAVHLNLVFFILKRLLNRSFVPFLTCLLYGLHPVNAAFINYITGHEILLFGIFLDISALFLLRYCQDLQKTGFQVISAVFFVLALFTQEISIAFLFFVVLAVFQLLKNIPLRQAIRVSLPYFAAAAVYVLWRLFMVTHTAGYIQRMFQYTDRMGIDALTYINTVLELIGWYLGQLVVPSQLILIKTMEPQTSGFLWKTISLIGAALLLVSAFRGRAKGNPAFFAILWALTGFVPLFGLALIYPYGGFVIEPHWFFFSSLGFFLCLGLLIEGAVGIFKRPINKIAVYGLIGILVVFFFKETQRYNYLWRTQESYCRYWISISPDFYFPNFWLARDLFGQNKLQEAEYHYKKAFIGKKNDWLVYAGLGDIQTVSGNFFKAREYYWEALRLNPDSVFLKKNVEWLNRKVISDRIIR